MLTLLENIISGYFLLALFFLLNRKFFFFAKINNDKFLNRLGLLLLVSAGLIFLYDFVSYLGNPHRDNPLVPEYFDGVVYISWIPYLLLITINFMKKWRLFWIVIIVNVLFSLAIFRICFTNFLMRLVFADLFGDSSFSDLHLMNLFASAIIAVLFMFVPDFLQKIKDRMFLSEEN